MERTRFSSISSFEFNLYHKQCTVDSVHTVHVEILDEDIYLFQNYLFVQ